MMKRVIIPNIMDDASDWPLIRETEDDRGLVTQDVEFVLLHKNHLDVQNTTQFHVCYSSIFVSLSADIKVIPIKIEEMRLSIR